MAQGIAERQVYRSTVRRRYEGRGKLLFFGEHAAVYGFPAVGITLPIGVRIALEDASAATGPRLHGVRPEYRAKFAELLAATGTILDDPEVFEEVDIRLESDIPAGRGLGSSASLCVAIVAAGAQRSARKPTSEALWAFAHEAERLFHGKPSGIDTGLASGEGIAALYPRSRGLPERRALSPPPFWLVAGTVPRSHTAHELIRKVGERYVEGRTSTVDAIRELGALSERAIAAFSVERTSVSLIDSLAPLADAAQERLSELGLSTPALEEVLAAGKGAGARVGKLSGAGGGGAFFFLAADEAEAAAINEAVATVLNRGNGDDTLFKPFRWTGTTLEIDPPANVGFYALRTT